MTDREDKHGSGSHPEGCRCDLHGGDYDWSHQYTNEQMEGMRRLSADLLEELKAKQAKQRAVRKPHVRVETRKVYVSDRGTKLTRHAAYVHAAKAVISAGCECVHDYENDGENAVKCRFHIFECECEQRDYEDGSCAARYCPRDYYKRVHARLVRLLKRVDARAGAPA